MIPRNDFENSNEQGTSTTTTTTATDITVMTSEQMTSSDVQRVEAISNMETTTGDNDTAEIRPGRKRKGPREGIVPLTLLSQDSDQTTDESLSTETSLVPDSDDNDNDTPITNKNDYAQQGAPTTSKSPAIKLRESRRKQHGQEGKPGNAKRPHSVPTNENNFDVLHSNLKEMRKYTGVETLYEEAEEKRKAEEFKQWQPSVVTREQRREVIGNYESQKGRESVSDRNVISWVQENEE
ncbi:unnamed protein product [Enterobius vermicularis]|uniref:Uncharacterized protein n=1 Tax=Enterobius vermicularis TaxID=51028 RepID=A0A0N4V508_ENTVE|nr:unnamed protein product [Enterobius vermicularis]